MTPELYFPPSWKSTQTMKHITRIVSTVIFLAWSDTKLILPQPASKTYVDDSHNEAQKHTRDCCYFLALDIESNFISFSQCTYLWNLRKWFWDAFWRDEGLHHVPSPLQACWSRLGRVLYELTLIQSSLTRPEFRSHFIWYKIREKRSDLIMHVVLSSLGTGVAVFGMQPIRALLDMIWLICSSDHTKVGTTIQHVLFKPLLSIIYLLLFMLNTMLLILGILSYIFPSLLSPVLLSCHVCSVSISLQIFKQNEACCYHSCVVLAPLAIESTTDY